MRKTLMLFVPLALLGGCTWGINLDPAAKQVRTAWNGDVSGCRELGKVTVSVMDHVGPVNRNDIKVRDELEVMARNEAAKMHADTVKPLGDPADGSQPWGAYSCGARAAPDRGAPAPSGDNGAAPSGNGTQTFPIKGG